jgi:aminoglycoside phosphotransferase (APT) family kinase protein
VTGHALGVQKMHADELPIDVPLVRHLLEEQFPEWAALPLARVPSMGTDNALYRLGCDMVVRLPRIKWATAGIEKDFRWLPALAPLLPVEIPAPLARGTPAAGFPWEWGVYGWLEGASPSPGAPAPELARDLAAFVLAMRRVPLADAPLCRRGKPLATQDEFTRNSLRAIAGTIDVEAATAAWEAALRVPDWSGPAVWLHADLLPGNILVREGRLSAVIDFAVAGVGDPACDLIPAWSVLDAEAREVFREAVDVDEATWARGRGWALSMGLGIVPYYKDTNPEFAAVGRHMISEVLADTNTRS